MSYNTPPLPNYYSEYAGHLEDRNVKEFCRNLTIMFRLNAIFESEQDDLIIRGRKYTRTYKDTVAYLTVLRCVLLVNELHVFFAP